MPEKNYAFMLWSKHGNAKNPRIHRNGKHGGLTISLMYLSNVEITKGLLK